MNAIHSSEIEVLKRKLQEIRKASLAATSKGDYKKVARLTRESASINNAIHQSAGSLPQSF
jgi:hypothetical protein